MMRPYLARGRLGVCTRVHVRAHVCVIFEKQEKIEF